MFQISKTFFGSNIVSGLIDKLSNTFPPLDLCRTMMCIQPITNDINFQMFEDPKVFLSV